MIKLNVDEEKRILTVELKGMVNEDDIEAAIDVLQQQFPGVGVHLRGQGRSYSVLSDWRELEGWERGAKTFGTVTSRTIGETAEKIAVVADDRFAREEPRLRDIFPGANVRFFPPQHWDDVSVWLRGR